MSEYLIGKKHHIGIAVENIESAKREYEVLGYISIGEEKSDADRHIKVLFMQKDDDTIELIMPLESGKKSPVDRFLGNGGGYTMYHIAYSVPDISEAIEYLRDNNYSQIEKITQSEIMNGCKEVYMFSRRMGLVELVEEK